MERRERILAERVEHRYVKSLMVRSVKALRFTTVMVGICIISVGFGVRSAERRLCCDVCMCSSSGALIANLYIISSHRGAANGANC